MTFIRTASGLSNLYLFVGVDAVIFLEGGDSITSEDVESGKFSDCSPDIQFWRGLFDIYLPALKFDFRSVGSKSTLSRIAQEIEVERQIM